MITPPGQRFSNQTRVRSKTQKDMDEIMGRLAQEGQILASRPQLPVQQLPETNAQTNEKTIQHYHAATYRAYTAQHISQEDK
jgi:hypothetical protein